MKSAALRQKFLDYFHAQGHAVVSSSSLVPSDDPTLLFTNAGMNQFKDCFLGLDKRAYTRAVTSQKCVRAGGKHNDLENVGYTARHHTFFEMLGNFSFGDYFKHDAIRFAWEFLTSPQWLGIAKDKLTITVYADDDEAYNIWAKDIGVPAERIIRIGDNKGARYASDNFWTMGDTGPCGPCTEIFYDHGAHIAGGPPGSPDEDGDRFIEIWNNVFMQFNRTADGVLHPLPAPSVDTGMGLERISAVMQGVHANYEIDLFQTLLAAAANATGCPNSDQPSLKVLADHIRSCSFLIADGVTPSNEGRGYVLRRIIRRAVRHGNKLGATDVFFYKMVDALVKEMGDAYPELREQQAHIERTLKAEEEQFARTLDVGLKILEQDLSQLNGTVIPGDVVFKLYDTYGFPMDLTADIARERGLTVDEVGFDSEMDKQRERARAASNFDIDYNTLIKLDAETTFTGYASTQGQGKVIALLRGAEHVNALHAGEQGAVVLDSTPFYAESGGQAGDCGSLESTSTRIDVRNTTKAGHAHLHHVVVIKGTLKISDTVQAHVDPAVRNTTALNHSATHLLHAALRNVLGEHVQQKGSLVNSERLRFDFSHHEAITAVQLSAIEQLVNEQIRHNSPVQTAEMDIDSARKQGAMALFGEKYGDTVRVLTMGDGFSVELCGGTHAQRTGDIGLLKVLSESGVAAGVRRIEAVTGAAALAYVATLEQQLQALAGLFKSGRDTVLDKATQNQQRVRELEKEIERLKQKLATGSGSDVASTVQNINGIALLAAVVEGADGKSLRITLDQLKNKLGSAVILLAAVEGDKVSLCAGVTPDLTARFNAGALVGYIAAQVGGKGGGRADMAQAGGTDAAALPAALASAAAWVTAQQ